MKKFFDNVQKKLSSSSASHSNFNFRRRSLSSINSLQIKVLRGGYNIDLQNVDNSFTKLHKAVYLNNGDRVLKCLGQFGVNIKDGYNRTPLHYASVNGNVRIIKMLIANGANVNCQDSDGRTPLIKAIECGHNEVVRILMESGSNVDLADYANGNTALHHCLINANIESAHYIIRNALIIDYNKRNHRKETFLHMAAKISDLYEVIEELIANGIEIEAQDELGRTAAQVAQMHNNIQSFQLIAKYVNAAKLQSQTDGLDVDFDLDEQVNQVPNNVSGDKAIIYDNIDHSPTTTHSTLNLPLESSSLCKSFTKKYSHSSSFLEETILEQSNNDNDHTGTGTILEIKTVQTADLPNSERGSLLNISLDEDKREEPVYSNSDSLSVPSSPIIIQTVKRTWPSDGIINEGEVDRTLSSDQMSDLDEMINKDLNTDVIIQIFDATTNNSLNVQQDNNSQQPPTQSIDNLQTIDKQLNHDNDIYSRKTSKSLEFKTQKPKIQSSKLNQYERENELEERIKSENSSTTTKKVTGQQTEQQSWMDEMKPQPRLLELNGLSKRSPSKWSTKPKSYAEALQKATNEIISSSTISTNRKNIGENVHSPADNQTHDQTSSPNSYRMDSNKKYYSQMSNEEIPSNGQIASDGAFIRNRNSNRRSSSRQQKTAKINKNQNQNSNYTNANELISSTNPNKSTDVLNNNNIRNERQYENNVYLDINKNNYNMVSEEFIAVSQSKSNVGPSAYATHSTDSTLTNSKTNKQTATTTKRLSYSAVVASSMPINYHHHKKSTEQTSSSSSSTTVAHSSTTSTPTRQHFKLKSKTFSPSMENYVVDNSEQQQNKYLNLITSLARLLEESSTPDEDDGGGEKKKLVQPGQMNDKILIKSIRKLILEAKENRKELNRKNIEIETLKKNVQHLLEQQLKQLEHLQEQPQETRLHDKKISDQFKCVNDGPKNKHGNEHEMVTLVKMAPLDHNANVLVDILKEQHHLKAKQYETILQEQLNENFALKKQCHFLKELIQIYEHSNKIHNEHFQRQLLEQTQKNNTARDDQQTSLTNTARQLNSLFDEFDEKLASFNQINQQRMKNIDEEIRLRCSFIRQIQDELVDLKWFTSQIIATFGLDAQAAQTNFTCDLSLMDAHVEHNQQQQSKPTSSEGSKEQHFTRMKMQQIHHLNSGRRLEWLPSPNRKSLSMNDLSISHDGGVAEHQTDYRKSRFSYTLGHSDSGSIGSLPLSDRNSASITLLDKTNIDYSNSFSYKSRYFQSKINQLRQQLAYVS